jgi:uncharacterized membrane protein YhaH (DUF805 family)
MHGFEAWCMHLLFCVSKLNTTVPSAALTIMSWRDL